MQYNFNLNPIGALAIPAEIIAFLKKPWSILTYIFVHENAFTIMKYPEKKLHDIPVHVHITLTQKSLTR